MLSNPHTQPLSLLKVKANWWQTQVNTRVPGFSVSQCSVVCILDCALMPTHCQKNKRQTDPELAGVWELRYTLKKERRHSPGSDKLRNLRGIWDVILSQRSVWASLAINSVTLLPSAPALCWFRHILPVAPGGLRVPINLWGRREAVLKEPRQTVAVNFTLEDDSEGELQL